MRSRILSGVVSESRAIHHDLPWLRGVLISIVALTCAGWLAYMCIPVDKGHKLAWLKYQTGVRVNLVMHPQIVSGAEALVRSVMTDSHSVQFRREYLNVNGMDGPSLCGEVRVRGSAEHFVDWIRFVSEPRRGSTGAVTLLGDGPYLRVTRKGSQALVNEDDPFDMSRWFVSAHSCDWVHGGAPLIIDGHLITPW